MATYTWFGGSGSGDVPTNWTPSGPPNSGDTAIVNSGTVQLDDAQLTSNTIFLNAGTFQLTNDSGSFSSGGSLVSDFDQGTTLFAGANGAAEIDTFGDFVNGGLIEATGTAHTSTTIKIEQNGTAPGYYLNYGAIEATAGNSMTIAVVGTSELFNAGLIYANGGSVLIKGSSAGIAGGYAPMLGGIALIGGGGTLTLNAGFPAGTDGSSPAFAFYDGDAGDTLKLNQVGQFGGRILGFQQGDTIDLGEALNVGSIVVTSDGQLLLENPGGTVLASLVLSSGAYNPGTFAVAGGIADGFTLATGGDGNARLTTDVVNSVWNNSSGSIQTAAAWSTGAVPGATSTVVIGINPTAGATGSLPPFVVTTGNAAVNVNSLSEVSSNATLQITSDTTVGTTNNRYALQQIAGKIEVTGGNTLTVTELKQDTPSTNLLIDAGGVLAITGHSNVGFANNGTLTQTTVANGTVFANGNTVGLFVTGTATVDGGTIDTGPVFNGPTLVSTGGLIDIGQNGGGMPGAMTVESGGTVIDTYSFLSSDPTSFGSLTLTGAGTTWDDASDPTDAFNTRGEMFIGGSDQTNNLPMPSSSGTAQLVVEESATLNEATHAEIADSAGSAGSVTIASGGVWNIGTSSAGGFLNVGDVGTGTLDINGGAVNILGGSTTASGGFGAGGTYVASGTVFSSGGGMGIAHHVGADGTVDVSGSGHLNITVPAAISGSGFGVGQYGHGVLDIFDGGTVAVSNGGISTGSDASTGDGTIVVGGTFNASGTVVSSGGPSSLLSSTSGLTIGKVGTGTLYVEIGGTVQVSGGSVNVGSTAGSYGFAEISGGLVEDTTNGLNVGLNSNGTLELINAGTISLNGGGIGVGISADGQGLLVIASGGMLSSTTNGATIGQNTGASGTLEILAGGIYNISTHGISDGLNAGATGTILVDGTGALLNIGTESGSYGLDIGQGGTGFLTVESNGVVSDAGAGINVGSNVGSTGTVLVASGGQIITTGAVGIVVGNQGNGLLTINAGGTVAAGNYFEIASNGASSSGAVAVNSGTLYDNGFFSVGGAGSGTLLVGGHALVDQTGINFTIGASSGGTGTVAVNNSTLDSQGVLSVGIAGSGKLTVSGAGVVNDGTGLVGIGYQSTGTGTVDVSGGTLLAGGMEVGGFGTGTLSVTNEGQVVLNGGTAASGLAVGSAVGGFGTGVVDINNGTISETGSGITVGGTNETGFLQIDASGELISTAAAANPGGPVPAAAQIGASGFGIAAVNVLGGTWIANGQIVVAGFGNGALDIADGGLVNAGTNAVLVGNGAGSAGTVTVGTGTLLAGMLEVSEPFSGTASGLVSIATGGTVDTGSLSEGAGGAVTVSGSLGVTGSNGISIGQSGNGPSALTVSGGGTVSDAGFLTVGGGGAGSLLVLGGGVVNLTGGNSFVLGLNAGGSGVVTVDGGILNAGSSNVSLGSSAATSGAVMVESGGTLSGGGFTVGNSGAGELTVTGVGSRLTAGGEMQVGGFSGGTGNLVVENHATATTGASNFVVGFDVGAQSGATGAATVSGAGSLLDNTGEFIVGDGGLGSLMIQSGATVVTAPGGMPTPTAAVISNQSGASGSSVNVTGAGSDWQVNGTLAVGAAGTGALNITAGGTVGATALNLGSQSASSGIVSISGDNSTLVTSGSLAVGGAGSGELLVLNGANATIGGDLDIATSGGSGNIDIDGTPGTLTINGNIVVGPTGAAVLTIGLNSTLTQDNGGVIAGSNFTENVYGNLDPVFSGGGSVNILTSKTVAYSAYVSNTTFNISPGVAFTLQAPTIYGSTSINIGQTGDSSGSELILNAGSFATASSVTFNDPMSTLVIGIDNLATIDVPPSGTSGFTAEPNPKLGDLLLGDFNGTIKNFQQGDSIDVDTYLSSASAGTLSVNGALVSVIDIANNATLGVLTFDSATNAAAAVADDAITLVPCFAAGTRISTERGEVAVEAIAVGDRVKVLLGGGLDGCSEVIWVGQREANCARHPTPRKVWPVRVSADAFGPGQPSTDLFLSPDHAVYVGGVLIPIRHLINGRTIVQVPVDRVTYHHVELAEHDVLLAEGLPAESFLDMRDGTNYANRSGSIRLYPDFSARMWEAFGCARLVVTGPELAAARALVADFVVERDAA